MNTLLLLGSLNMFLAVALGAFGAHALKERLLPEMAKVYQTGVQYHMAHALGLLIVPLISNHVMHRSLVNLSGWFLFAGILLFSGSLYALSISGVKKLGAITPLGGLAFLAGWGLLLAAILQG
jgi:uncharacterized membrane protein YgdD (TMEM256/DUF423 family)